MQRPSRPPPVDLGAFDALRHHPAIQRAADLRREDAAIVERIKLTAEAETDELEELHYAIVTVIAKRLAGVRAALAGGAFPGAVTRDLDQLHAALTQHLSNLRRIP